MIFFGKRRGISKIDILENKIMLDDAILTFPLSLKEIEEILGKPNRIYKKDEFELCYIYDKLGIVFNAVLTNIKNFYKTCNIYVDDDHNINSVTFYLGEKVIPKNYEKEEELPYKSCNLSITFEGYEPHFFGSLATIGDLWIYCSTPYGEDINGEVEKLSYPLTISFRPKPIRKPANYKIKKSVEDVLHFDNLNFKLAIMQVLMYELEVLEPYFDIYDFAAQYRGKEIDTESEEIIKPALNFFKRLPIPKKMAEKVETIYMDGGNEIYMNIAPQWDGEDGFFDLNEISLAELNQFPNLKKATIMSSNFEKVSQVFEEANIEVELL